MSDAPVLLDLDEVHRVELPPGCTAENSLVLSSSQVSTFDLCARKWQFLWSWGMETPPRDYLHFGNALHGKLATRLGGEPNHAVEVVSKRDELLIDHLVEHALTSGMAEARADQDIEYQFLRHLVDVRHGEKTIHVFVTGIIDVLRVAAAEVHDHKTAKDTKHLAVSTRTTKCRGCPGPACERCRGTGEHDHPRYLGRSRQMLTYAYELLAQREERGLLLPDKVKLVHNAFTKDYDAPLARRIEAEVSPDEVLAHWRALQEQAREFVAVRENHKVRDQWYSVRGPEDPARACSAYAGCPFRLVCLGRWTVQQYVHNTEMKMTQQTTQQGTNGAVGAPPASNGPPPVNGPVVAEKFAIHINGATNNGPLTRAEVSAQLATLGDKWDAAMVYRSGDAGWSKPSALGFAAQSGPVAPPVQQAEPAAWFVAGCVACSKNPRPGFSSVGDACRICDVEQGRRGGHPSHHYTIAQTQTGGLLYSLKPEHSAVQAPPPPQGVQNMNAPQPLPPGVTSVGAPQPAPGQVQQQATGEGQAAPRRSRKKAAQSPQAAEAFQSQNAISRATGNDTIAGFFLCQGCLPVGPAEVVDLANVLAEWGAKLAASCQPPAASYYDLNAFDRRDRLARMAAEIAADLEGAVVIYSGTSPDAEALANALRPHAARVFVGAR